MALTTTNAQITVQDGAGALTNMNNGTNVVVTPGALLSFTLQSTSGIAHWQLIFVCPAYPSLHQKSLEWYQGQANLLQLNLPAVQIAGTVPISGVQVISIVTDSVQSIAQSSGFLQTRNWATVPMQHFVRACIPSALAAYTNVNGVLTANANGALASQDGVTLAVGDLILLPNGIAAAAVDAGIYQVTSLGGASAKYVLTAAPDWQIGAQVMPKTEILVSEGTLYGGTTWVNTLTGLTNVVGTASFTFYPRMVSQSITLASGTATVTNVPILSATKVQMQFTRTTVSGTASTVTYQPVGTITTGALGTVTFAYDATVAAGTINASDGSTGCLTIWNQC